MATGRPPLRHSWVASDRPVARLIARPLREFLHTEAAGGVLLLLATLAALIWANSPFQATYERLWTTEIGVRIGDFEVAEDLRHWVNDGLMALFFFVVGLEIKRELVVGELNDPRAAVLPVVAAIGGMVMPAIIYMTLNYGGERAGWAIPMATDIAFAVGVLSLLGSRCPDSLKTFLLSLAIVDDIGAIFLIALFYSEGIEPAWLAAALFSVGLVIFMRGRRVWWIPAYVIVGVAVWFATLKSGIHATIAGVSLGLLAPARPADPQGAGDAVAEASALMKDAEPSTIRRITVQAQEAVSVAERLEHILHPWTSYAVIPIFALANAGVRLNASLLESALSAPVTVGIVAGLVGGKVLGISAFSWAATRIGIAALPRDVSWRQVWGLGAIAGIGFTVSLFIANLAFDDGQAISQAKIGILLGSAAAALVGAAALGTARSK